MKDREIYEGEMEFFADPEFSQEYGRRTKISKKRPPKKKNKGRFSSCFIDGKIFGFFHQFSELVAYGKDGKILKNITLKELNDINISSPLKDAEFFTRYGEINLRVIPFRAIFVSGKFSCRVDARWCRSPGKHRETHISEVITWKAEF